MKTIIRKLLARIGLYTRTECSAHWTEGYLLGVKSAGIGIVRDNRGRFKSAKGGAK